MSFVNDGGWVVRLENGREDLLWVHGPKTQPQGRFTVHSTAPDVSWPSTAMMLLLL
jgi:2-iminoacetate synthase ThiH